MAENFDSAWVAQLVHPDVLPVLLMVSAILLLTALTVRQGLRDRANRNQMQKR